MTVDIEHSIQEGYTGKYIAFGEVMKVYLQGDQLKDRIQGFTFNLNPLSETTFRPRHWLADIGMANLLGVPIDLRQLKIEFMVGDDVSADFMIIALGGFSYEIIPKYPNIGEIPPFLENISGDYDLLPRLTASVVGTAVLGQSSIWAEGHGVQGGSGVSGADLPGVVAEVLVSYVALFIADQVIISHYIRVERVLNNTRKIFMAATRAGQRLVITCVGASPWVPESCVL